MNNTSSKEIISKIFGISHCFNRIVQMKMRDRRCHNRDDFQMIYQKGQVEVLGILLKEDGLSGKEIGEIMGIRAASVAELISKLAKQGYIEKKTNEKDKRISNIYLTQKGKELICKKKDEKIGEVEEIFAVLSEEEKKELVHLLDKVYGSLKVNVSQKEEEMIAKRFDRGARRRRRQDE